MQQEVQEVPAQAYQRIFEMAGLRAPPRESDTPANMATRAAILRSTDTAQHLRERQRQLSNAACPKQETTTSSTDDDDVPELEGSTDDDDVPELDGWHYRDGSGLPRDAESPEDEGAVVNQRQAEKVQRLMQLYSGGGVMQLDEGGVMQLDEEGLDTALAIAESMVAGAGAGAGVVHPHRQQEEKEEEVSEDDWRHHQEVTALLLLQEEDAAIAADNADDQLDIGYEHTCWLSLTRGLPADRVKGLLLSIKGKGASVADLHLIKDLRKEANLPDDTGVRSGRAEGSMHNLVTSPQGHTIEQLIAHLETWQDGGAPHRYGGKGGTKHSGSRPTRGQLAVFEVPIKTIRQLGDCTTARSGGGIDMLLYEAAPWICLRMDDG
jgi:hypothetical protein